MWGSLIFFFLLLITCTISLWCISHEDEYDILSLFHITCYTGPIILICTPCDKKDAKVSDIQNGAQGAYVPASKCQKNLNILPHVHVLCSLTKFQEK
jgi:hypothetical protein